jgi:hypothetical protein
MKVLWFAATMLTVLRASAESSRAAHASSAIGPGKLAVEAPMYAARIFSSTQAVAAVASGDFDPTHSGNEIACLMADGSIVELALNASGWTARTIFVYRWDAVPWEDPRARVSLNIGDVLAANPGSEIVLSYYQHVVAVYYVPVSGWTNQIVADFTDTLGTTWGAEVGDCDRANAGEEVFTIFEGTFDFSFGTVYGETNGGWGENEIYNSEVGMDAAIGNSNPDLLGNEIIVVTEMGPAYEIMPPPTGGSGPWPRRTIWDDRENAGWVVRVGDVDPENPGNEIVYGTRDSNRIMMSRHRGTNRHEVEILLTGINTNSLNSMLDVAIGQVFAGSISVEILGVDMSGSVYVVQQVSNDWRGSVLWQDTNALYAVLAADLISTPGDEVAVAGASGAVTLLCNPSPSVSVTLTGGERAVLSWNGLVGITYTVEAATNLAAASSWKPLTNVTYQGGFSGALSYTNADVAAKRFFRVKATW